jgi:hypothetical protein
MADDLMDEWSFDEVSGERPSGHPEPCTGPSRPDSSRSSRRECNNYGLRAPGTAILSALLVSAIFLGNGPWSPPALRESDALPTRNRTPLGAYWWRGGSDESVSPEKKRWRRFDGGSRQRVAKCKSSLVTNTIHVNPMFLFGFLLSSAIHFLASFSRRCKGLVLS